MLQNFINFGKFLKNEITELCKGVHCVDLGESFQTHIFLQNLASIQPRTSPVKFARPLAMQQTPRGPDDRGAAPAAREPLLRRGAEEGAALHLRRLGRDEAAQR